MDNSVLSPPSRWQAQFSEWSPSIHYAQIQIMPTCLLPPRRIYDFEFLYVRHGEAATYMNGERYLLPAGKMVCIPAGILHQNEIVSVPNAQLIGIHFDFFDELDIKTDEDMIVNGSDAEPGRFAIEAVAESFSPLFEKPIVTPSPAFVHLMEQIVTEFNMRQPGYLLICKAMMLQLLGLLLRGQVMHNPTSLDSPHAPGIAAIMAQIEAAPQDSWSNQLIASNLNLSGDYMIKMFKKLAGQSPGEFVQTVRLREARRLLRETTDSIEAIGSKVGYADVHYFSRIFRKSEGISPSQYRKLMWNY